MSWWKRNEVAALRGTPAVRRQKNYMGESGYAYEYFFEGFREHAGEREYVFTFSGDRKTWAPVSVCLPAAVLPAGLAENERYAVAKLTLFHAMDTRPGPQAMGEAVRLEALLAGELLERLGLSPSEIE